MSGWAYYTAGSGVCQGIVLFGFATATCQFDRGYEDCAAVWYVTVHLPPAVRSLFTVKREPLAPLYGGKESVLRGAGEPMSLS